MPIWFPPAVFVTVIAGSVGTVWWFLSNPRSSAHDVNPTAFEPATWSLSSGPAAASLSETRGAMAPGLRAIAGKSFSQSTRELAESLPRDAEAQYAAATAAFGSGERATARDFLQRILELDPDHHGALFDMAGLAFDEGDYAAASELYARLRKQNPGHRLTAYRQFLCRLLLEGEQEADLSALPPDSTPGLYARAAAAWKTGHQQSAITLARMAREARSPNTALFEADLRLVGFHE